MAAVWGRASHYRVLCLWGSTVRGIRRNCRFTTDLQAPFLGGIRGDLEQDSAQWDVSVGLIAILAEGAMLAVAMSCSGTSQCAGLPGNGFRGDRYKMNTEMTRLYSVFSYFCRPTWGGVVPPSPRTCSNLWFCPFFRTPIGRQSMPNTATDSSTFPGRMGAWSTSTLPRRSADGTGREFTQPWPGSRGGWYVCMWSLVS